MKITHKKKKKKLLYLHFKLLVKFVNANIIWKKIQIFNCKIYAWKKS